MACTTGWIKTKFGFILFKNRDRRPEENILSNFLFKSHELVTFEDKTFKGCWLGINNNYIAVSSTLGPFRDVLSGYSCVNENFELNKTVLQKANSVREATDLYQRLFFEQKIGKSYNVIICDSKQANLIELALGKAKVKTFNDVVFRTNTFISMEEYNKDSALVDRSRQRLERVLELAGNVRKAEDVIPILKSHSNNEMGNICRHDLAVTVGSVVLELRGDRVTVYHLLNQSPCGGKYKREALNLNSNLTI